MYKVYSDELIHYGVPGMKWGVRNDPKKASRLGLESVDNFGISNQRLNVSGRNEKRARERALAVRNELGRLSGHYDRNKKNTNLPQNAKEAKEKGYIHLSKNMSAMHQFVTEDGKANSKWISKNGHKEVVFSGKGKNQHLTTHAEDEGSYNYFNPKKNPLGHALFDVAPYVLFGNSPEDQTTMETRIRKSINSMNTKTTSVDQTVQTKKTEKFSQRIIKLYRRKS